MISSSFNASRHKYTLFIAADGNFRLQRKRKLDDPEDFALNSGNGYFVETERYQSYVSTVRDAKDVWEPRRFNQFISLIAQ